MISKPTSLFKPKEPERKWDLDEFLDDLYAFDVPTGHDPHEYYECIMSAFVSALSLSITEDLTVAERFGIPSLNKLFLRSDVVDASNELLRIGWRVGNLPFTIITKPQDSNQVFKRTGPSMYTLLRGEGPIYVFMDQSLKDYPYIADINLDKKKRLVGLHQYQFTKDSLKYQTFNQSQLLVLINASGMRLMSDCGILVIPDGKVIKVLTNIYKKKKEA